MTQPLPLQPPDTPSRVVREQLLPLVASLEHADLHWLAGYAAGLAQGRSGGTLAVPATPTLAAGAAPVAATPASLTILVASQTGNSKRQGERLLSAATAAGLNARLVRTADYSLKELARERLLFVVISTQGDGDPPDEARALFDQLLGKRAPKLPQLHYSVLSLGDSSYPKFCAAGQILDERLAALGAQRLHERADCDLDIETLATPWIANSVERARDQFADLRIATVTPLRGAAVGAPSPADAAHATVASRESPYAAEVLAVQRLTGRGSDHEVYHLELALGDSGLRYEPGDALGILPRNPLESVQAVLEATRLDGDQSVTRDGVTLPLAEWLTSRLEITQVSRPTLLALQERHVSAALQELLAPNSREALRQRILQSQVADFLRDFPADWDAGSLLGALRPLAPRLYSIASSQASVGEEVHTTVALVGNAAAGRDGTSSPRWGAASRYVATQGVDGTMPVFIETNTRFRLPRDAARDIIMVGPGTGVAPFRAFVQERAEAGASGRNWLLFGARSFDNDFLYQLEWQAALRQKTLHRLDLAFSRDQAEKVYVQHRLLAAGRDVWDWLQGGAHFYVCGDATRMAPDVNSALLQIGQQHGGLSDEAAGEWLADLTAQGRYLRDVY